MNASNRSCSWVVVACALEALIACASARAAVELTFEEANLLAPLAAKATHRIVIQPPLILEETRVDGRLVYGFMFDRTRATGNRFEHRNKLYFETRRDGIDPKDIVLRPVEEARGGYKCRRGEMKREGAAFLDVCAAPGKDFALAPEQIALLALRGVAAGENVFVHRRVFRGGKPLLERSLKQVRKIPDLPKSHFSIPSGYKKGPSNPASRAKRFAHP